MTVHPAGAFTAGQGTRTLVMPSPAGNAKTPNRNRLRVFMLWG